MTELAMIDSNVSFPKWPEGFEWSAGIPWRSMKRGDSVLVRNVPMFAIAMEIERIEKKFGGKWVMNPSPNNDFENIRVWCKREPENILSMSNDEARIVKLLRSSGGVCSMNDVTRATQYMTSDERSEAISGLDERGYITVTVEPPAGGKSGRPKTIISLKKDE